MTPKTRLPGWPWPLVLAIVAGSTAVMPAAPAAPAVSAAPIVLGPAESRLQLAQLGALIGGQYDNEPQRHYLDGMKRGATAPPRLNLQIRPLTDSPLRFALEERNGNEHQAIAYRGTVTLDADPQTRVIIMSLEGTACTWLWGRINGLWRASPVGECTSPTSRVLPQLAGKIWWLGAEELWIERPGEAVMIELGRARDYDCFVAIDVPNGKSFVRAGLKLHDRGGTVRVTTDETPPRTLELMLRRGVWPSNSGNNLVELLTLYLQEVGAREVMGTGWATPESSRVGFGTGGPSTPGNRAVNARCKQIG